MIHRLWRVIVVAWALRTSWLAAAYVLEWQGVARHHVETAGFILAGLLLITIAAAPRAEMAVDRGSDANPSSQPNGFAWLGIIAFAFTLYWPALSIGFLSDDFVLVERVESWMLLDPAWQMVRPLPLAIWAVADRMLPEAWLAPSLHALNVALHGVNGCLAGVLMRRVGYVAPSPALAAVLFVAFPAAVEPVAWISGMFDVLLTTLALLAACLVVSTRQSTTRIVAGTLALTAAALMVKETAIALPLILLIALWMASGSTATRLWAVAASAALVAAYVGWRVAAGASAPFPPLDRYALKEFITRPFGALFIPIHESTLAGMTVVVAAAAALVPLALAARLAIPRRPAAEYARLIAGAALWVLAAAAPVFTLLYVGPDLQGSRYVYLAAAGWSMALAVTIAGTRPGRLWRTVAIAVAVGWVAASTVAVRSHLVHWTNAARVRDAALERAMADPAACASPVTATALSDVGGAYVFRNGFQEALRRECGPNPEPRTPNRAPRTEP